MRFFGKKKERKQQNQQQPSQRVAEARTDASSQNIDSGYRDQTKQSAGGGKQLQSRSSTSQQPTAPKSVLAQNHLPATPAAPPSILHKNTQYGGGGALSPQPPQASFCHGMPSHDHNPRVRFEPTADQSVASQSVASVPHMMVGANSVASSSAMSSNAMLNRVMDEEYQRLNAMGMGFDR